MSCDSSSQSQRAQDENRMQAGFLVYGATGSTGELRARAAIQRGLRPILAGRNTLYLKNSG